MVPPFKNNTSYPENEDRSAATGGDNPTLALFGDTIKPRLAHLPHCIRVHLCQQLLNVSESGAKLSFLTNFDNRKSEQQ